LQYIIIIIAIIIIIIKNNARYSQPSSEVMDDGGIFENLL